MEAFVAAVSNINSAVNNVVWGPIMLILLVGTGIYLTFRTRFLQVTKFGNIMKNTFGVAFNKEKNKSDESSITPFQAVSTALASTVGVGNIAGVATAIVLGGPGAVFWMWLSAFFGMVTKYAEITLAVKFRVKNAQGEWAGGPMYYIEKGLGWKWMGVVFAILCVLASFGIGNMTQINTIAGSLEESFAFNPLISGIVIAVLIALVILGGIKRIGKVASTLVPFMALLYVAGSIVALCLAGQHIPAAFGQIFGTAFSMEAVGGGIAGYAIFLAMRYGVARGVFSNEAGLGSAPIAHSATSNTNPVTQGVWGVFEVFVDTIIICTMTALVILTSGVLGTTDASGAALSSQAFGAILGPAGGYLVTIGILLFAFTTILGWSYYGERSLEYLFPNKSKMAGYIYKAIFIVCIVLGATMNLELVWNIADTLNGLMAIPNLIGVLGLSGVVIALSKEYLKDSNFLHTVPEENKLDK